MLTKDDFQDPEDFFDLTKLEQEIDKPSIRDLWHDGLIEGTDPDGKTDDFAVYQDDPVGFAQDVLGVRLTDAQKQLLEAVKEYEIVQVKSATGVGKTFVLAVLAVWVYKSWKWSQVYTAAAPPESNLKKLLWGEIFSLTREHTYLFQLDRVRNSLHIDRHPKQFITGVSIPKDARADDIETKWSGKHSPTLVFIFDEGDGIPDPVYKGADGCMSGGTFIRQIVCYNPKKKSGEAYRRDQEKRAYIIKMSALDHPNVITGKNIVPGAVSRAKTVKRIYEWTEPMPLDKEPDSTCWKPPRFLIGAQARKENGDMTPPLPPGWRVIMDDQFYYKVLGEYPAGGQNQLIWDNWIDDAVSKWESMKAMNKGEVVPPAGIRPIMGFDVADLGPDHHSVGFRYGGWWDVPITWKDSGPNEAANKAYDLYLERQAKRCMVDSIGVGAGVPGKMMERARDRRHRINAVRVMVSEKSMGFSDEGKFYQVRDEAYWLMRKDFRESKVALPPPTLNQACQRLHEALKTATYDIQGSSLRIIPKKAWKNILGFSPDELESYVLTYAPSNVWMGGI